MLFRNSNGELKNINKLEFINDKDYYNTILQFMNTNAGLNTNNSHNIAIEISSIK